ncbi:bacterial translation initiation factor 2 (bIF-2) [Syntrophus gentianae]|uniref:Translation initiation factor IF-2 n=1 Tax=Syntrophus gentianae TaxID=43775 RepID=A0A1H7UF80_9BACT|nr:translation initiation factor IF-2 [Syntrophus gentianae]SEL95683.1 bacterial translation initiation factor 2 (bIF-2) [Syntrophus gentianae]
MSKKRVYELARELGIDNKELISRLEKLGITVKSHSGTLEDNEVDRVTKEFHARGSKEMVEERIKTTVIRRRAVPVSQEEEIAEMPPVETEKELQVEAPEKPAPPEEAKPVEVVEAKPVLHEKEPAPAVKKPLPTPVIPSKEPVAPSVPEISKEEKVEIPEKIKEEAKREPIVPEPEKAPVAPKVVPAGEKAPVRVEAAGTVAREAGKIQPGRREVRPPLSRPPSGGGAPARQAPQREAVKKPEIGGIPRPAAPPGREAPKVEGEKAKKKIKTPDEVPVREQPPAKKKITLRKAPEKKDFRKVLEEETVERGAKPGRWKEEKKAAPVKMKKTEITVPKAIKRRIRVGEAITVGDLAKKMGVKANEVINKLMRMGLMATINQSIDFDAATLIATEFDYQVEQAGMEYDESMFKVESVVENLKPRAPVVTIMGHVDHGKTSLLDAIRKTRVTEGEAGGITQAIGAYHVNLKGREIVFLDTPGHEAFTAMRARGAQVTDIVVLVVAADDGVMDQTKEAINHSKVAGVPIIVAINKIDKPEADPGRIRQALTEYGLVPEEWGGETIFSEVSAKQKIGIEELLELILLQADILELKADPDRPARGVVIEARLDRGRGPVATVLIQEGTLHEGDAFVSKTEYGRVRALNDDQGRRIKEAGPATPVEVIGFSRVPQASAEFNAVEDEKKARSIGEYWMRKERERELSATSKITLEQLYEKMKEGVKELNVILRADVQGSLEALADALTKLSTEDIKLKVIHGSTGAITETDVMLASASNAIILGFNVRPDARVVELAETEGVDIKLYDIIYNVIADVRAAMEGLLEPEYKEVVLGRAEVRDLFRVPKVGTVAGSFVLDGKVIRKANVKLVRDGVTVFDGKIASLRRFKDDVKEVLAGFECGIGIDGFNDLRVGDQIEAYVSEKVERKL